MKALMPKPLFVICALCSLILAPSLLSAQRVEGWKDQSGSLPGIETNELLPVLGIWGGGAVAAALIPIPDTDWHFKQGNQRRSKKTPQEFLSLGQPVKLWSTREYGKQVHGTIRSITANAFVINDGQTDYTIPLDQVHEIMDLETANKQSRIRRIRGSVLLAGISVGFLYSARATSNSLAPSEPLLYAGLSAGMVGASILNLVVKSKTEKAYLEWLNESGEELSALPPAPQKSIHLGLSMANPLPNELRGEGRLGPRPVLGSFTIQF